MRKYKTVFSAYQNENIEREFFANTTIFLFGSDIGLPSFPIINYIYYLQTKLKIKGGKNEIDMTRYNINTLDSMGMGKRCVILNKIYE